MTASTLITALRRRRRWLLKAYLLHVGCFMSTCALAATDSVHVSVATALWLVLVTIPPVLVYTVLVHRSCRRLDPAAPTVGVWKLAVVTVCFTPLESSLVLPVKNLVVSRRLLRKHAGMRDCRDESRAYHEAMNSPGGGRMGKTPYCFAARQPDACPLCGSVAVVPICYGYPAHDVFMAFMDGRVDLGGCVVGKADPAWRCHGCRAEIYPENTRAAIEADPRLLDRDD